MQGRVREPLLDKWPHLLGQQLRAGREVVSGSLSSLLWAPKAKVCFPRGSGQVEQEADEGPASLIWNPA